MINSVPNNDKYHQGNFIPVNKDKVVKLNAKGGVYYRSSWEKKIMVWLDHNTKITRWGAECLVIPYEMTHFDKGDINVKGHCYYPDFYYEMIMDDGSTKCVVAEVKPYKEYLMVKNLTEGNLTIPDKGMKQLKNFEYDLNMAYKNQSKWQTMIRWCDMKGYKFIIITEQHLKKYNL